MASASWFGGESSSSSPPEEEGVLAGGCAGLTYRQRLTMFGGLAAGALLFFFLASLSLLAPTKFAKLFFLGSFFLVSALAFLVGPWSLLVSAFQPDRLPASLAYLGAVCATLFCATVLGSALLTLLALVAQGAAAGYLALSYLPFAQVFLGMARNILPV